jgi:dTMP kinase
LTGDGYIAGFSFSGLQSMPTKKPTRGYLITFEGIDGCGKTTQLRLAADFLSSRGHSVVTLREPGSTPVSERIRKILLDRRIDMGAITELLLYEAARSELVAAELSPLLSDGTTVLCDRFYDSTTAYQGYGRRLDITAVKRLHQLATGGLTPDLTFVFDLPLSTALERRGKRPDRLESQSLAFHRRVAAGFRAIAKSEPRRVKLLNARRSVEAIHNDVRNILKRKLRLK